MTERQSPCPRCRQENSPRNRFCGSCGTPLTSGELRVKAGGSLTPEAAPGAWERPVVVRRIASTRWAPSIPVICNEDIGPVESLKRSNALVRGRFWFVLGTATLAFDLEEAVIHVGALATGSITGSHTWGEWVGGSIVAALAIPLAALTTSLAYSSVAKLAGPVEGS
jgi:hypothetical protein